MTNQASEVECPKCDGQGWGLGYGHNCGGDDSLCVIRCPIPTQKLCNVCSGTGKIKLEAELENLMRNNIHTFADEYLELDECVAALTAYTNKQKLELLDRLLEHGEDFTTFGDGGLSVAVEYIEAERNKLKGRR